MSAAVQAMTADATTYTAARLRECPDCGQFQTVPPLPPAARAMCLRCDAVLRHTRRDPLSLPLALNAAGLILFGLGTGMTMMSVSTAGQQHVASLISGPVGLEQHGLWSLSVVVLITTAAVPLARLLCMLTVLVGLRLPNPPGELPAVYAWVERLRPWSMVEIFMLGLFVAYVRLSAMVQIDLGIAVYALGALILVMAAADFMLDRQAVWEAMERHPPRLRRKRKPRTVGLLGRPLSRMGCDTCGLVSRAVPGAECSRCGSALRHRKPDSIARTWALSVAALILYIPANIYPVLTVIRFGSGHPSTILGGVQELIETGMWPLAALVFFASIAVPVLKLVGLGVLLVTTQMGVQARLEDRTVLYRIVDAIGRWSMIDIFMESILVALVQFGSVVTVNPGVGAVVFSAVVILTMFAAQSFDPRLMWDCAGGPPHE
jgi:paraquat-inducible protein A